MTWKFDKYLEKKKTMNVKSESGVENAGFEMDEVDLGKPNTGW